MSSADNSEPDPIDVLAGTVPPSVDNDEFRRSVFADTVSVIHRRRRLKRFSLVAALAGCYLAGVATMQLLGPGLPTGTRPLAEGGSPTQDVAPPVTPVARPPQRIAAVAQSRFEALRRVSDRYLYEKRDIPRALRYYCRALDYASAEERAISPGEDSWLLMALKQSQMEENSDEQNDG